MLTGIGNSVNTGASSTSGKFLANVIVNRNIPSQYVPPRTNITPNQTEIEEMENDEMSTVSVT